MPKLGRIFSSQCQKRRCSKHQIRFAISDLKQGTGKSPKANSVVKVNYEGRLIDGTVFDSSIARNQPAEFQVSQVIQGWTGRLTADESRAKYRFFIPAQLGYGQIGSGDVIEPNSTLIFDVELLEIVK